MEVKIHIDSIHGAIDMITLHICESLSSDLTILCGVTSPIKLDHHCKKHQAVTITINYRSQQKIYVAYIAKLRHLMAASYEIQLESSFKQLDARSHRRCFRKKTVIAIMKALLQDNQACLFDYSRLLAVYRPIDYLVQFDETDYAFLRRLMFEHGICYYYDQATVVLLDDASQFCGRQVEPSCFTVWRRSACYGPERLQLVSEYSSHVIHRRNHYNLCQYAYDAHFKRQSDADVYLKAWSNTYHQSEDVVFACSDVLMLQPCMRLDVTAISCTITEIYHNLVMSRGVVIYENQFYASSGQQMISLPIMSRPRCFGNQSATIKSVEEGVQARAALVYDWDENCVASPYVPIRQYWAGSSYGAAFYPQLNQRVAVGCINGDLALPVILGQRLTTSHGLQIGGNTHYLKFLTEGVFFESTGLFQITACQQITLSAKSHKMESTSSFSTHFSASTIKLSSIDAIHLKVGSSQIDITTDSIHIKASKIEINSPT